jgi:hypothetical protein
LLIPGELTARDTDPPPGNPQQETPNIAVLYEPRDLAGSEGVGPIEEGGVSFGMGLSHLPCSYARSGKRLCLTQRSRGSRGQERTAREPLLPLIPLRENL